MFTKIKNIFKAKPIPNKITVLPTPPALGTKEFKPCITNHVYAHAPTSAQPLSRYKNPSADTHKSQYANSTSPPDDNTFTTYLIANALATSPATSHSSCSSVSSSDYSSSSSSCDSSGSASSSD
jgi:hypothetical protein